MGCSTQEARTHDTSFGTRWGVWDLVLEKWLSWGLENRSNAQYRIDQDWYPCTPRPCVPSWVCEVPANGYESDGCGNRRLNTACNACTPSWKCEVPANGYESDGCGNRRVNPACRPIVVPPPICTEGATRQVKCPSTDKMITQKCTGNAWVTIKDECKEDYTNLIIVVIIIILFIILARK